MHPFFTGENVMTDPTYLIHLVMGAIIGGVGIACTVSLQRESKADMQRLLDGLDAAVDAINTHTASTHTEQLATNAALAHSMENSLARSQACIEKSVFLHASHTDDTIQRVLTRPEARVAPEGVPADHPAARGGLCA